MAMPTDLGIVDMMLDPPRPDPEVWRTRFSHLFRDKESTDGSLIHAAGYMFKEGEGVAKTDDPVTETLREMDKYNIEFAVMRVESKETGEALVKYPDRLIGYLPLDPNAGMDAVREIVATHEQYGISAVSFFPSGVNPPCPINDKRAYPIYSKCVELDIAVFANAGVPGPRFPYESQYVGHVDEVCWFFPELRFVFRHGCEPWADLAVKLMLKWPNLYYSTTAFTPRFYPKEIIEYANTRGADKIMYGGYYPHGLPLEKVFKEMPNVPFRDHVWPKFLRENALRVLKPELHRKRHPDPNAPQWQPTGLKPADEGGVQDPT